jgi:carbonic anhydrase/acetyltransferase-like protein (isoleucine patch superfamily)
MTAQTALNLLPYGGTAPEIAGPPRHAAAGHALVGRIMLGRDAWLGAGVVIRADGHFMRGGDDLHMGRGSTVHIAHDVYPALIGHRVTVGANAVVHACTVHDDCVVEEDCVVLDGSVVESGSVIEAGSVVFSRGQLPGGWLYAGRPAKPVRELQPGELAARRDALRARNEAAAHDWAAGVSAGGVFDPTAFVANTALLRGPIRAAEKSSIWYGCRLDSTGGEIAIGERSNVQDNSVLTTGRGAIRIGVDTTIGHNVELASCTIGDRCLIGIGSRVAPGTVAEDDIFLAAGAATTPGQVLASGFLWGGQPARQLTVLDKRKKALVLETIITYCDYAAELKRAQVEAASRRAA